SSVTPSVTTKRTLSCTKPGKTGKISFVRRLYVSVTLSWTGFSGSTAGRVSATVRDSAGTTVISPAVGPNAKGHISRLDPRSQTWVISVGAPLWCLLFLLAVLRRGRVKG